jgi:hypothetical protein
MTAPAISKPVKAKPVDAAFVGGFELVVAGPVVPFELEPAVPPGELGVVAGGDAVVLANRRFSDAVFVMVEPAGVRQVAVIVTVPALTETGGFPSTATVGPLPMTATMDTEPSAAAVVVPAGAPLTSRLVVVPGMHPAKVVWTVCPGEYEPRKVVVPGG